MTKYTSSDSRSNLSLDSIEDDELEPWHGLIQKLSEFHLNSLHAIFKDGKYKSDRSICKREEGLGKEEFVAAIDEVFGNCKHSLQATILYCQIDKEEKRTITWNQFLDFIIEHATAIPNPRVVLNLADIFSPPHVKRETISKIVLIETQKYFCYAILAKYGRVGLYDGNMSFLTSYHTIMSREDITRKDEERRRRNRWITDAIFLEDVLMFIITTSARSITIYDASGLKHVPLWLILGVPNVIQCFSYHSNIINKANTLFMGDDSGQILSFAFLQPKIGLLRKKHNDKLSLFYWIELPNEKDFVTIKNFGKIHNDSIRELHYFADNNTIATCSRDVNGSVIIKHLENRRKSYIFKMKRGASCFALSRLLKLLVTGSDDGTIRIWNTVMTSKPLAILKDHRNGLVDIQIMELQELFLSCSRDGVLKLWNIKEQKCIQTIKIKFPSFQVLGKIIEWGTNSIYPGPKRQENRLDVNETSESNEISYQSPQTVWERTHIFVTCCNYMAQINMTFTEMVISFDMPVLSPPPLQNSVLIPTNWRICDENVDLASSSSEETVDIDDEKIAKHMESLKFILEKDFLTENGLRNNINYQIATLETKKLQMQSAVSRCAPYLALDIQEIKEIVLSPDLPVPNSKRIRNLVDRTHRMLSAASTKSQVLSELSSGSRTKSSRSSIITFD